MAKETYHMICQVADYIYSKFDKSAQKLLRQKAEKINPLGEDFNFGKFLYELPKFYSSNPYQVNEFIAEFIQTLSKQPIEPILRRIVFLFSTLFAEAIGQEIITIAFIDGMALTFFNLAKIIGAIDSHNANDAQSFQTSKQILTDIYTTELNDYEFIIDTFLGGQAQAKFSQTFGEYAKYIVDTNTQLINTRPWKIESLENFKAEVERFSKKLREVV